MIWYNKVKKQLILTLIRKGKQNETFKFKENIVSSFSHSYRAFYGGMRGGEDRR